MRILTGIDVPFRPFGGSLLCTDDWYSDLPADVEVRFLTLPAPDQDQWWRMHDVVFLDIEKTRGQEGFMRYVAKLKELVQQQIDEFKPDVIHCQHLNYGLSRAIAEIDTDIPRIGICHGTDVQGAVNDLFFKDNMRRICDSLDLLVFPNQTMADDFFSVYGWRKAHIINPLGIPDRYFDNIKRPESFDGKRPLQLLYAGRLLRWKGADIAVESLAHATHDIQLTVIGNEDQAGYKTAMLKFVAAHGLEHQVKFRDQIPREALLEEFLKFDAIILPSRSLEAFSLTAVEAQAKGLPVIYNPGGGIADTVGDGGIMITDNTPEGVASLLDALYDHPEQLRVERDHGYRNAEQYKVSDSQTRLFALSRRIIDQRAGQTHAQS